MIQPVVQPGRLQKDFFVWRFFAKFVSPSRPGLEAAEWD
jgi:hypothetical protein